LTQQEAASEAPPCDQGDSDATGLTPAVDSLRKDDTLSEADKVTSSQGMDDIETDAFLVNRVLMKTLNQPRIYEETKLTLNEFHFKESQCKVLGINEKTTKDVPSKAETGTDENTTWKSIPAKSEPNENDSLNMASGLGKEIKFMMIITRRINPT